MRRVSTATGALLALAGTALLTVWSLTGLVNQAAAPGQASLNTLLGLVAGVGAAGCGVWLAAGAVLTVLGSLPGALASGADAVAQKIAPRAWRRLIHLTLGVALVSGPVAAAAPAWAGHHQLSVRADIDSGQSTIAAAHPGDPDALPPIDRPADTALEQTTWIPSAPPTPIPVTPPASPVVTGHPRATAAVEDHVVVRRGDTLWHIAGRYLGADASAAEIATEWPRWWTANRDVIGPDPDVILPGQVLRPPI